MLYFFKFLHPVIKAVAYVQTCQGTDTGPTHFTILKSYITPNLHKKCYVFVECKSTTWWLYQYFLELMPYFLKTHFIVYLSRNSAQLSSLACLPSAQPIS